MTEIKQHVKIRQHEDKTVVWTLRDETGAIVNSTGYTVEVKVMVEDGGYLIATKAGSVVGDGSAGQVQAAFAQADFATVYGDYRYQMTATKTGSKTYPAVGDFIIHKALP